MSIFDQSHSAQRGGANAPPILPGQVRAYSRKSVATEGKSNSKSIQDQNKANLAVCARHGLPATEDDLRPEKPGHSGSEWWSGGGFSGLEGDDAGTQATRPVLTSIMRDIVGNQCKAFVCWSFDRLWRSVAICDQMIEILSRYGVRLFTSEGEADISTPSGRQAVRSDAIAAQHYRERCQRNSPRGIKESMEAGVNTCDANTLGYRGGPRGSRQVHHIEAEQDVVRRIFRLYDGSEAGSPPMTPARIAALLMEEAYMWTPDLRARRGKQRIAETENIIYDWQITRVLKDCRYQGYARQYKIEYPCPAYLVDGTTPVVDPSLFKRVQDKLAGGKRSGNADSQTYALTGLVRCGICAQGVSVYTYYYPKGKEPGEERRAIRCWRNIRTESWCWCKHTLPHIRLDVLDGYIDRVLSPLLLTEVTDRLASAEQDGPQSRLVTLQRQLDDVQRQCEALADEADGMPREIIKIKYDKIVKRRESLMEQMQQARREADALGKMQPHLTNLTDMTPEQRVQAVRAVIRWVAVIPNDAPREPDARKGRTRPATIAAHVVFLSAWGQMHTAVACREHTGETDHRQIVLRPAMLSETIGSVAQFPRPDEFAAGLRRAYGTRKYDYDPADVLPGYQTATALRDINAPMEVNNQSRAA